jgi:protein required for attachment to host cells
VQEHRTVVLVANASRARLFQREQGTGVLVLMQEYEHPESRAKNIDLMSDKPGRSFPSSTHTYHAGMEEPTIPKRHEAELFARELGDELSRRHNEHTFDELVIVAAPGFLGMLRGALGTHHNHVIDRVMLWLDKDYTQQDPRTIAERLAVAGLEDQGQPEEIQPGREGQDGPEGGKQAPKQGQKAVA